MTNTPPIRPNLQPLEMPPLAWDDEHRAASLAQVYAFAETLARETIGWYFKKKSWPKRFSRLLRFAAIALVALGGLDPVLKASGFGICDLIPPLAGAPVCEADWGYLAFALAGAAILFDRFFGVSTGWMRSVTTALAIQRRLRAFQLEWNTLAAKLSTPPSAGEVAVALDAVHRFTESVMAEVQRETEAWVSEFRSNLAELQRRTEDELVNARPGSIHVHVTNPGDADPDTGITILLDGVAKGRLIGEHMVITNVRPGAYVVLAQGVKGDAEIQDSTIANVSTGQPERVDLTLR